MSWIIHLLVTVGAVIGALAIVVGLNSGLRLKSGRRVNFSIFLAVAIVLALIANGPLTDWYGSQGQPDWAEYMEERYNRSLAEHSLAEPDIQAIADQVRREEFEKGIQALEEFRNPEALRHFEASASPTFTSGARLSLLKLQGNVLLVLGRLDGAKDRYEEGLRIAETNGSELDRAAFIGNLGGVWAERGELDKAEDFHKQALDIYKKLGYQVGEGQQLNNLGIVYRRGDYLIIAEEHFL